MQIGVSATPKEAREAIEILVYDYNSQRMHQALGNVTPAAAYFGYAQELREHRETMREMARTRRVELNRGKAEEVDPAA